MSRRQYPVRLKPDSRGERWRVSGDQIMAGVHAEAECRGPCVLHRPSGHHMREWRLLWRWDRHVFERTCEHGVGHPDPDDRYVGLPHPGSQGVHGCDGCCRGAG